MRVPDDRALSARLLRGARSTASNPHAADIHSSEAMPAVGIERARYSSWCRSATRLQRYLGCLRELRADLCFDALECVDLLVAAQTGLHFEIDVDEQFVGAQVHRARYIGCADGRIA